MVGDAAGDGGKIWTSHSKSLGGSLKSESEERKSDGRFNSSKIFLVSRGIDGWWYEDASGSGGIALAVTGAAKYLDFTSSLGVIPGKSLVIENPRPIQPDRVTEEHIWICDSTGVSILEPRFARAWAFQLQPEQYECRILFASCYSVVSFDV